MNEQRLFGAPRPVKYRLTMEDWDRHIPGHGNRALDDDERKWAFTVLESVLAGETIPELDRQCQKCDRIIDQSDATCPECRMESERDSIVSRPESTRKIIPPLLRRERSISHAWMESKREKAPLARTSSSKTAASIMGAWVEKYPNSHPQWFAFEDLAAFIRQHSRTPERVDSIRRKPGLLVVEGMVGDGWTGTIAEGMARILVHRVQYRLPTLICSPVLPEHSQDQFPGRVGILMAQAEQVAFRKEEAEKV
jgi:hypothetical protein